MKNKTIKQLKYNNFIVEIEKEDDMLDFWLYQKNNSIKIFMFGLCKKDIKNQYELKSIIYNNLDQYIAFYQETIQKLENEDI